MAHKKTIIALHRGAGGLVEDASLYGNIMQCCRVLGLDYPAVKQELKNFGKSVTPEFEIIERETSRSFYQLKNRKK
jgi:hypothetical protein